MARSIIGLGTVVLCTIVAAFPGGATAASGFDSKLLPQQPVAQGTGGGAATMSPYATRAAIQVLRKGGNAVDGAVAAAAALGVAEPFVAGPGGGGFFVYYRARDHRVFTIDGREKAPSGATEKLFLDANGQPIPFATAVESGLSVGVPGNVATWGVALDRFGSKRMSSVLRPAEELARRGFPLDRSLVGAIAGNRAKLAKFPESAKLFLPGGEVPAVEDVLRNPDLARVYADIGDRGWRSFYTGRIARELAAEVREPTTTPGTAPVAGGTMTADDLRNYTAPFRKAARWSYRGYDLVGMAPPSSGGTTVGEAMNILETGPMDGDRTDALYRYIEALKLAFADRGKYVGDPDFVDVPTETLLSDSYAAQRAALIGPNPLPTPVAPGNPEGQTNHLVVSDRHGNVVSYTNTIEQIAGSGITVRGFLLNNELTDFNFPTGTANSPAANKRPRSSMAPTIVLRDGRAIEAVGSPGGSTIITTVLQTLINQIDFGMSLPEAIEAPRASQRNGAATDAEPAFVDQYGAGLAARGQTLAPCCAGAADGPKYIGIVAALKLLPRGRVQAATEAWRGGGGSAMVVRPENPD